MRRAFLAALLAATSPAIAQDAMPKLTYPQTERGPTVDEQFGVKVADPYRWLEADVRSDDKVRAWVTAQNGVTDAYLATLPGRQIFKDRMKALYDYERFGLPTKKGGKYFYSRNTGLQNQSVLYVRDGLNGAGRVLIDPNAWAKDGATALGGYAASHDGTKLLYSIQDGGTDWRTLKVMDVATAKDTGDQLEWVRGLGDWMKDGSGFFYTRYPEPPAGQKYQALTLNSKVYFHKLGTPQSADRLVYETPDMPKRGHYAGVTDDGRYLLIYTSEGTDNRNELSVVDLQSADWKPRKLIDGLTNEWSVIGSTGSKLYVKTNKDAPRNRVVTMDIASANPQPVQLIAEDAAVLDGASIVGGVMLADYMVDVKSEVRRYGLDGTPMGKVALPGIGSAGGFGGDPQDPETFFAFTSFATPSTIYRYDVRTNQATVWAAPKVDFDPNAYEVKQVFYPSKDGTKIPMFIVHKKGLKGPAPTILYGYGGFNVSLLPSFSATRIAWMEQGGVIAQPNLRGGGEYGKAWHDAGRLQNKQNVFDDMIAAAEYLDKTGISSPQKTVIQGGSNGGLLVGAVINQRPDLFAAALPAVGVMDMTRFDRWTAGRYWVDDYGYPSKEADFKALYKYSPYHNVQSGKAYPAILATTADTDDRVVPGHTFKYTAAIQNADIGPKPHLVRIETRAGHGSGKPTDKIIEEAADLWAFSAKWTGMDVKPVR
ncbi:prolyl endopeptidase [Sphingomonas sp. Leaf33]|uniref:prolyl oligopeptidase family serine peptidase n=1 Tax=Sphingomonas sp. Leaf33 TaxID=1736215 RepID=UPI0006F47465|nr:prolyl oligopeptidase family serine peptidase [Sphingomonas sp. Leaf33]KQN25758.1 prolyl endopeptidase [Sphingomonas sp. Leaf33]